MEADPNHDALASLTSSIDTLREVAYASGYTAGFSAALAAIQGESTSDDDLAEQFSVLRRFIAQSPEPQSLRA
jgi:hypothetical protein